MSPEQMRKKSLAEAEALRHHRYAQANGEMRGVQSEPMNSNRIHAAEARVHAATEKERRDIGEYDMSPNASIRSQ